MGYFQKNVQFNPTQTFEILKISQLYDFFIPIPSFHFLKLKIQEKAKIEKFQWKKICKKK